jgi:HK97 gp10 family phage protein
MAVDFSELTHLRTELGTASRRIGPAASAVLRKASYDIEADAKTFAPVDTGALKSSISTTITGRAGAGAMTAEIGPSVKYGVYVEYGTSEQPGQPFLNPAFERTLPRFTSALEQAGARSLLGGEGRR